ncbi:MAG TPA: hypothetical protein VGK32_13535 [Vicinamibacterales bacterium]|jgi:hypothetical protein
MKAVLSFAGSAVEVCAHGPRAVALMDFLFHQVPRDPGAKPHARFELSEAVGGLSLSIDDAVCFEGADDGTAGSVFVGEVMYQIACRSRGGLLFHAAALAHHGQSVLLPGKSRSGKTTLVAWLAAKGFDYLTDEMVFVPSGGTAIDAFSRPLQLRRASRPVIENLIGPLPAEAVQVGSAFDLILPAALRSTVGIGRSDLALIVFPQYEAASPGELIRLSPAQAGLHLMEGLINARNLRAHGFPEVAALARQVPAYRAAYSSFSQVEGELLCLLP